jgi:hypothetical protein
MPVPSAFDPPPGVVKANGQVYQTGVGNQMQPGVPMASAAPPTVGPTPGIAAGIQALIASLAKAFAPKSLTQADKRTEQAVDQQSGSPQSSDLGSQF